MKYAVIRVSREKDCLEKLVEILEKLNICKVKEFPVSNFEIDITIEYDTTERMVQFLDEFIGFYNVMIIKD